jgi:hypothetical protein
LTSCKTTAQESGNIRFGWLLNNHVMDSFFNIIENRLEPVNLWLLATGTFPRLDSDISNIKKELKDIMTDDVSKLEHRLKNCKNQCYSCHLCERTFGLSDIDSLIEF